MRRTRYCITWNAGKLKGNCVAWCRQRNVPLMAYSPFNQGRLDSCSLCKAVAQRHNTGPYQIALAWLLHQDNVIVIPKSSRRDHIEENHAAAEISLTSTDLEEIDRIFPSPAGASSLKMV